MEDYKLFKVNGWDCYIVAESESEAIIIAGLSSIGISEDNLKEVRCKLSNNVEDRVYYSYDEVEPFIDSFRF